MAAAAALFESVASTRSLTQENFRHAKFKKANPREKCEVELAKILQIPVRSAHDL
jgi:hypothetical protein